MATLLETRSLKKSFGGLTVLDGVDLEIREGEVRCLIGPNGSGKSTLLKTIMGLHAPDDGSITFLSERIDGKRPFEIVRRGLSIKFQIVSIFRELTVYQNLRVPAQRLGLDSDARIERIQRMLETISLMNHSDTTAGNLSHGQQQWLEIGMAIVNDPRLLILDEPTAGMTPDETAETAQIVARLNAERGTAVVVVEHDMNFVRYLDRPISVLHQGRIFFEGSLEQVRVNSKIDEIYFGSRK